MRLSGKSSILLAFIILALPVYAHAENGPVHHTRAPAFIPFEFSNDCSLRPLIEYALIQRENPEEALLSVAQRLRTSKVKVPATVALKAIPELLIELCHLYEKRLAGTVEKSAFDIIVAPAVSMLRSLLSILQEEGKKRNEHAALEYYEVRDFIQQALEALGQQDILSALENSTISQSNSLVSFNGCHDKKTFEAVLRLHQKLDELTVFIDERSDELEELLVDELSNSVDEIQSFVAAENEFTRDYVSTVVNDGNQVLADELFVVEENILEELLSVAQSDQMQQDFVQTWTLIGSLNDRSAVFTTAAQIDNAQLSVVGWLKSIYRQLIGV